MIELKRINNPRETQRVGDQVRAEGQVRHEVSLQNEWALTTDGH